MKKIIILVVTLLVAGTTVYFYIHKGTLIKVNCTEPEGRTLEKNDLVYSSDDTYGKGDLCLIYTGSDYPTSDMFIPNQTANFEIVDPTCNDALKCYIAESQCNDKNVEYKIKRCPNCSRGNCWTPEYYKYFIIDQNLGLDIKGANATYGYLNLSNYVINYTDGSNAQVRVFSSEDDALNFYSANTKEDKYTINAGKFYVKDNIRYLKYNEGSYFWQIKNYTIGVSNDKLFSLYFDKYLKELNQTQ